MMTLNYIIGKICWGGGKIIVWKFVKKNLITVFLQSQLVFTVKKLIYK